MLAIFAIAILLEAVKPADWDDEEDGEWSLPAKAQPYMKKQIGCIASHHILCISHLPPGRSSRGLI